MSQLLALSFDVPASPSIRLQPSATVGSRRGAGWGFAWYPANAYAAAVVRDPRPVRDGGITRVLRDWDRFRGTVFLCHVRGAAKRPTEQDTHPFVRPYAARDFSFAHNGQLDQARTRALALGEVPVFEPVGTTDSERAFCWLLTRMREQGARSLADVGYEELHGWLRELNELGTLTVLMSDGQDIVAYADASGYRPLHFVRRKPPHAETLLTNEVLELDHSDPLDRNRTMVLFSSTPLMEGSSVLPPGALLVVRRAAYRYSSVPMSLLESTTEPLQPHPPAPQSPPTPGPVPNGTTRHSVLVISPTQLQPAASGGAPAQVSSALGERHYRVLHRTLYRYDSEVERSSHTLRLQPSDDGTQRILEHSIDVSVDCESQAFEDVFGNRSLRVWIENPYAELEIVARSVVAIQATDMASSRRRTTIPLVWMPWQRQMMTPFLLPPELAETQLRELSAFGMSFAERQDYDVMETLRDINRTIWEDFDYVQGVTSLSTTPFEVYTSRRGVCQDFANLFICLARLLGVPARYRVGYIHTGSNYENRLQSEASHAWAEAYLPWLGWRGFDPTNGCLAGLDHVRVATGRNFRDATPTSGTLFKGGGGEKLEVQVEVETLTAKPAADAAKPAAQ